MYLSQLRSALLLFPRHIQVFCPTLLLQCACAFMTAKNKLLTGYISAKSGRNLIIDEATLGKVKKLKKTPDSQDGLVFYCFNLQT